jgi:thioredoxin-like negative regulator of GroEL
MCYGHSMKVRASVVLSVLVALAACDKSKSEQVASTATGSDQPTAPEIDAATEGAGTITWIHDDYAAALERARSEDKPIVIDMWAPWCHTCLSMQHTTLVDAGLNAVSPRYIWLGLDTDKEANAGALAKFPVKVWPTFFVVSPENEAIQARFQGAASVVQFREFLVQGEKGHLEAKASAGKLTRNSVGWTVRDGDQKAVAGDFQQAASSYEAALSKAPKDWPRTPDVLVAQISALYKAKAFDACVDLAVESGEKIRLGTRRARQTSRTTPTRARPRSRT